MRADIKRRKLLFKLKTQPANSNNGQKRNEHSTEVDGCMHSREAEIANLVGEHLQKKKKKKWEVEGKSGK
jgi:hypothetical protein